MKIFYPVFNGETLTFYLSERPIQKEGEYNLPFAKKLNKWKNTQCTAEVHEKHIQYLTTLSLNAIPKSKTNQISLQSELSKGVDLSYISHMIVIDDEARVDMSSFMGTYNMNEVKNVVKGMDKLLKGTKPKYFVRLIQLTKS